MTWDDVRRVFTTRYIGNFASAEDCFEAVSRAIPLNKDLAVDYLAYADAASQYFRNPELVLETVTDHLGRYRSAKKRDDLIRADDHQAAITRLIEHKIKIRNLEKTFS